MLRRVVLVGLPLSLVAQSWSRAEVYFADAPDSQASRWAASSTSKEEDVESYAALKARVRLLESQLADTEARRLEDITKEMMHVEFEKESASQEIHDWMFIALFILLISLSIVFEYGQGALIEKLENNSAHQGLLNVVYALQKELTLLGFVVLVATALQKTGGMQAMSDLVATCYGRMNERRLHRERHADYQSLEETPEELELAELFEDVHMLLFLIMICFILLVLILLMLAIRRQDLYDRAESQTTKVLKQKFIALPVASVFAKINLLHQMQYRILRTEFFRQAKKRDALVRPSSFKFSNYMGACMAEFIVQLIEIPIATWFFLMVLVLCVKPFLALKHDNMALGMMVTSLCLFAMLCALTFSIRQTYRMCLPKNCPTYFDVDPVKGNKGERVTTPQYMCKMEFKRPRNVVEKYLCLWFCGTVSPTKQEQCFPFWKNGPLVNNFFIRLQVFGHAMFLGVYFRVLCAEPKFIIKHWCAALVQWIPFLFGLRYVWPQLLFWNTISTCTGNSRHEKIMSHIIRQQTEAAFRQYHYLIYGINTRTRMWQIRCLKTLQEYKTYIRNFVKASQDNLENEEKGEYSQAFDKWDTNKDGIDQEELSHVLKAYGIKAEFAEHIANTWFQGKIFREGVNGYFSDDEEAQRGALRKAMTTPMQGEASAKAPDYSCLCSTPRDENNEDAARRRRNSLSLPQDMLLENLDDEEVPLFECKDRLSETEFEFLMMQMRELEVKGCDIEAICAWLRKHVCGKDADTILPEHFLKEEGPLNDVAEWCQMRTDSDVHQLFLIVKNPDNENEAVQQISCEDLAHWMSRAMNVRSHSAVKSSMGLKKTLHPTS